MSYQNFESEKNYRFFIGEINNFHLVKIFCSSSLKNNSIKENYK